MVWCHIHNPSHKRCNKPQKKTCISILILEHLTSFSTPSNLKTRDYVIWHNFLELDRVGPIDNRPSNDKLTHFVGRKKKIMTCDMGHMTYNTWHVHRTCDIWWGWLFSPNFSSLGLTIWQRQCFENWEEEDQSMT